MEFVRRNVGWIAIAIAIAIALITYIVFGGKARASDAPGSRAPQQQIVTAQAPLDWSGFYTGLHGGYGWAETSGQIGPFGPTTITYGGDRDGFFYGAHIGAQKQFGGLVLGVEGSLSKANIEGSSAVGGIILPPGSSLTTSYHMAWLATAEAKAGLDMGRLLPFATAGGACAQGKAGVSFTSPGPSFSANSSDEYNCGWTVGAGADWMVTQNIIATVKYNYVDFGSSTPCFAFPGSGGACVGVPFDVKAHLVRGALSMKF